MDNSSLKVNMYGMMTMAANADQLNVDELLKTGWSLRDIPWTDKEDFIDIMEVIGDENVKFMAMTTMKNRVRASTLMNKKGLEYFNEYLQERNK